MFMVIIFVFLLHSSKKYQNNYVVKKLGKPCASFTKSMFFVFCQMHCGLVARSFQMFRCNVALGPGEVYLDADYSVQCGNMPHLQAVGLAIFMLISVGLGIPAY